MKEYLRLLQRCACLVFDFLFPPLCHVCRTPLADGETHICTLCLSKLPRTMFHRQKDNPMELRLMGLAPFERAFAHFFYAHGSGVAGIVHDFKYRGMPGLATRMGVIAAEESIASGSFNGLDAIVPVPMHWWKKGMRGYNQTEEIAKGISRVTGIPVIRALKVTKTHPTQTGLAQVRRFENAEGVFALRKQYRLDGMHLLLLDDVCTTGATLTAAAKALAAGAPGCRITVFALAAVF